LTAKTESKEVNRSAVNVALRGGNEHPDDATARVLTRPEVQAAVAIKSLQGDNHDVNAVIRELERQVTAVQAGDFRRAEAMLIAQAHTLDELFSNLARRASRNFDSGYRDAGETYLRLALKAQSQCRTTWESLAEIKNPRPVAFVRQANIAHGPQQVNNGMGQAMEPTPRAEKSAFHSNELLGCNSGERLDIGAPETAVGANPELAAVGEVDRPKN
jgi:hypothetical protein